WTPAVIDTSEPGTFEYVFHPEASYQCADSFVMEIVIDTLIIPQFEQIEPLCLNQEPPLLPAENFNNVPGSWEPAIIRTDSVGVFEYVFIPEEGIHCAAPDTMRIEVLPPVVPEFDPFDLLCVGETPYALPETDKNGVPGTWSPDIIDTSVADTLWFVFTPDNTVRCAEPVEMFVVVTENRPPLALDDYSLTIQNEEVGLFVLDNDSDPNGELDVASVQVIDGPVNGTAEVNAG